ncbi:hypothetical protein DFH09DRAFT_1094065 [Mycena vulgaris]|nr:hypothetical protein DFH09DRAFT_1094065 [Mycena vulgaris]
MFDSGTPMHALSVPKGTSIYVAVREHEQADMGRGRGGVQARAVGEWEGGGHHDEAVRDLRKHRDVPRTGGAAASRDQCVAPLMIRFSQHNDQRLPAELAEYLSLVITSWETLRPLVTGVECLVEVGK